MKKLLAFALTLVMVCGCLMAFASCGEKGPAEGQKIAYVLTETGDTYSQGLGGNFKTAFEDLGGYVYSESFPKNTSDFSSYLQKAMDKKAEVIFAPNSTTVASNLLKQAQQLGVKCPILAGDTWEHNAILEAAKGTDLQVYCSTFFDENDNNVTAKDFVEGFRAWLESNPDKKTMNGGNTIVAAVSALGFDAYNAAYAAIEIAAAEKGEDLTSVDVAKALWKVELDGVTGKLKFDQNGDAIKDSAYIKKAVDGKFEFQTVQTISNDAKQGTCPDYGDVKGIALDKTNHKIVIGIYEPTSGDNGDGGKQEVIAVEYANYCKPTIEIAGTTYTIETFLADNGSDDSKAATAASSIISKGALVSIGSYGSGVSIAAGDSFRNAGVPAIGASCTNAAVTAGNDFYFRTCFLDPFQGSVMAKFAYELIK